MPSIYCVRNGRMEHVGVNYHACMCPELYNMPCMWNANIIYMLCCSVGMQKISMCYGVVWAKLTHIVDLIVWAEKKCLG
jgi:hypothetical protein